MTIYKYQRIVTPGPNGTTLYFRNTENNDATEIANFEGWYYVFVPSDITLPEQHTEIQLQPVILTDELKKQLKSVSRPCQLINEEMQRRIRLKYSADDEQYFSRISAGAAIGTYTFQPGEQDELAVYNAYVESIRSWGRSEREKIGL